MRFSTLISDSGVPGGRLRFLRRLEAGARTAAEESTRPPFDALWQTARPRIWGLCVRLSGSVDDADDLTQEVGIRALQGYPSFRGDAESLTWLFRITVNTVLRHRERTARTGGASFETLLARDEGMLPAPVAEQPEQRLLAAESVPRIRRLLDDLPDDLRTPLILQVYEELKCREIAATLEIPLGTVLSRLHSARQRLKTALEQDPDHED